MAIKTAIVPKKHQFVADEIQEWHATFGLKRDLVVGNDLTEHLPVKRPGKLIDITVTIKVAPVGANAILDIKVRHSTWQSIFNSGAELVLPAGVSTTIVYGAFATGHDILYYGDEFRIDCLQAGTIVPGKQILVVARWKITSPYYES